MGEGSKSKGQATAHIDVNLDEHDMLKEIMEKVKLQEELLIKKAEKNSKIDNRGINIQKWEILG